MTSMMEASKKLKSKNTKTGKRGIDSALNALTALHGINASVPSVSGGVKPSVSGSVKPGVNEKVDTVHQNTPNESSSSDSEKSDSDSEKSVWDAIEELETDPDYKDWVREVWQPLFKDTINICAEKAFLQWRSQGGVCAATGTVLVGVAGGKGLYSPALVKVNPNRPLADEDNCKFVANFVACMLQSLERYRPSWSQFVRLVTSIDNE